MKVALLCFCAVLSCCVLNSLATNCFGFLIPIHALFTVGNSYIRFRKTFFNAERLQVPLNEMPTIKQSFDLFEIMLTNELFYTAPTQSVPLSVFNTKPKQSVLSKQKRGSIQSLLSEHTNNLPVPFLIQTRGIGAKASTAVTSAVNHVLEQQPQVVVNGLIATGGTAIGGVVWMGYDNSKTERQLESNERIASEDRRSAELQHYRAFF